MTKEEKNRKIAEWLGFKLWKNGYEQWTLTYPVGWAKGETDRREFHGSRELLQEHIPDFFTDESASALVLEKMRDAFVVLEWTAVDGWHVGTGSPINDSAVDTFDRDRKTCIAEACLKLIDTPHASGQTR